ncbi:calcium-binding protein [Gloeocapsopsis dulcis]|uniref:Peptidase M10 serralysin C-terminal domain-containing protein n=1 Tax=Gloeocapsopsis dulcis AAB1 = 1H9 TaxID=1433147 RepID=A0A6N8G1F5_9CHRO|nr:calcium-binding protein [Gloeocapsopsis dulcis]MUL38415.1 hypothetical protein [Gloeocapsopsis dulcis AAB1 = 1H9]WNN89201.1 calcium-binding protein [Gloeocapsopsis dulcis]
MARFIRSGMADSPIIEATNADDFVLAGPQDNVVRAKGGNDFVFGEDGFDTLYGGRGNDSLFGGNDDDILYGGNGNDFLYGENGNDSLFGGDGHDTLIGGEGADTLTGGSGKDIFYFGTLPDNSTDFDTITDFQPGADKIQVEGVEFFNGIDDRSLARFIYNGVTGELSFDAGAGFLTKFAQLQTNLNFVASRDISIV